MSLAAYASETTKPLPQLKPAEKSVIEINAHFKPFYRKKTKKSFLLVSFFIFSLHNPRPTWSGVVLLTINQLFYSNVLFQDARILIKVDLHFWNEMPDYFTLLEQEEPISHLPVENYVVSVVVAYWACWPDARQHRNSAKILISGWIRT